LLQALTNVLNNFVSIAVLCCMDECPSHIDTVSLHVCLNLSSCSAQRQPTNTVCAWPRRKVEGKAAVQQPAQHVVHQAVRLQVLPQICPLGLQLSCMQVTRTTQIWCALKILMLHGSSYMIIMCLPVFKQSYHWQSQEVQMIVVPSIASTSPQSKGPLPTLALTQQA
ncbi:MAG: hypothetical protein ACKPKO_59695, partial [Candidatus Fonsibacter sp.]